MHQKQTSLAAVDGLKGSFLVIYILYLTGCWFPLSIQKRQEEGKSNAIEGFVGVETLHTVCNIVKHRVDQVKGRLFFTTNSNVSAKGFHGYSVFFHISFYDR